MKTKIITLESHDDLISLRDRMSWAKTPRILLVIPKFEKVVLRQVDLKVLQRHAATLGAQLGLVTRVRSIRQDAEALDIPVFESTAEAQRVIWAQIPRRRLPRPPRAENLRQKREQVQIREEAWKNHPATRIASLAVGVLSVLSIAALFTPRAQIHVPPIVQTQDLTVPVIASPSSDAVTITGNVPAREKRIVVDGAQTVIVTGEAAVPQSKANGFVEFKNLTAKDVVIPAGTIVSAGKFQFKTMEELSIEGGIGKTKKTPIEALEGGLAGNVEAESINVVEGNMGLSVSVSNPEPTLGGRDLASVQASDEDRARAKDLLLEFLSNEAREKYSKQIPLGDVLFEDTISASKILVEEFDPPAGAAGSTLTLTMQVEFSARYASASDLRELASLALNASIPSGFTPVTDSLKVELVAKTEPGPNDSQRLSIRAERQVVQQVDTARLIRLVQGRSFISAQSELEKSVSGDSAPQIEIFPSWWPWLPFLPFQIEVVRQ